MCMAAVYRKKHRYFGRNLDYERSYGEAVTVVPRRYPFRFRHAPCSDDHPAMIGMAAVVGGYPLYFDATNEHGLSMAGLNFPDNAFYGDMEDGKHNVSPFEFIPWVLSSCSSADEARDLISDTNLVSEDFSRELPLSPLHWIVSDGDSSIVVEQMRDGMHVYDNPVGILTNNPPFPYHLQNLSNYMGLSSGNPKNRFSDLLDLGPYSRGMGAIGLPGDLSSASRFVKAAFTKFNSVCGDSDVEAVTQFFHIMGSVEQQMGCCDVGNGLYEHTIYTSCCDTDSGIYYYRTYGNSRITGVDMMAEDLDSSELVSYPIIAGQDILMQNRHGSA